MNAKEAVAEDVSTALQHLGRENADEVRCCMFVRGERERLMRVPASC